MRYAMILVRRHGAPDCEREVLAKPGRPDVVLAAYKQEFCFERHHEKYGLAEYVVSDRGIEKSRRLTLPPEPPEPEPPKKSKSK